MMTIAQHFLLSAAARTLKLKDIYRMSDDEAFKAFAAIRFAENGGEGSHWDDLETLYHAHRINHSQAYSWDGACTNQAES